MQVLEARGLNMLVRPRKVLPTVLTICAAIYAVKDPEGAATVVKGAAHLIMSVSESLARFVHTVNS
ncbi:hypothetical protein HII36_47900 [Nonomuraea sp. NN258]|uniref:hypothetical protein n=1 Tax=Nonomuraea antri TaxID=2730852 RepID=UPI0015681E60|nr:hypothetical protein [Nonomuraea antri]NRQ39502.1 hypothetical protein [Nonomuraea antri]